MVLTMGELVFVGLGLYDESGISLRGLMEAQGADTVFVELYTSLMPGLSLTRLTELMGRNLTILSRREIEDENGEVILKAAQRGRAVLLVPGDPMIATTHVALRIEAEKRGIKTRIIHGSSIISAAIGLSGLHSYKFGRSVTIPFQENFSETPYNVIAENKERGLHTLCLLDIDAERRRYLMISEALEMLLTIEDRKRRGVVTSETLVVGVARAGGPNPVVKADIVSKILKYDFGPPPYTIIFPGNLHFTEAEALITFAGAPKEIRDSVK